MDGNKEFDMGTEMDGTATDCQIGFCAAGEYEGKLIMLWEYAASSRDDVVYKIMAGARREGFRGTIGERLSELEWRIIRFSVVES